MSRSASRGPVRAAGRVRALNAALDAAVPPATKTIAVRVAALACDSSGRGLRGGLHLLLELAHLAQRGGVDHVGHRAVDAARAEFSGGLAPPPRPDAGLLAEQRREDLGLLLAEAGQLAH